ncbi:MAG: hypothetical protein QXK37_05480 [Candidatus Woesearchaeota archaeon]
MRKLKAEKTNEQLVGRYTIPISVVTDRRLSIFEAIIEYLKEKKDLSFHEIAVLLNRDDRTVWTIYNRSIKKRSKSE